MGSAQRKLRETRSAIYWPLCHAIATTANFPPYVKTKWCEGQFDFPFYLPCWSSHTLDSGLHILNLVEISFLHSWICVGAQQGAQLKIASIKITGTGTNKEPNKQCFSNRVRRRLRRSRMIKLLRNEGTLYQKLFPNADCDLYWAYLRTFNDFITNQSKGSSVSSLLVHQLCNNPSY